MDWNKLVAKESEKLLNYINKIVGDIDNSRDIVQDVFLACFENIDRIDENYILAWMYRTAHNKAINFVKKQKRYILCVPPEQMHVEDFEEEKRKQRQAQFIKECFQRLKPRHSMVLELQYYQKRSYKEIAEITGMSMGAVESILVRAKRECKKIMESMNMGNG